MDKIRIAFATIVLFFLYTQGVPLTVVVFLGLMFAAILLLKDRLWKKIDGLFDSQKAIPKEPKWLRWIIVFAAFMLAYYAVKLVAFYILGLAGFDVQAELIKSMNVTQ
jgi:chromate transport protein ChrA